MNLYLVTKSSPYFAFTVYCFYTKITSLMPVLSTRIVLDCFYLLIFYSEKFSTDVCRLPYAVNVNLNLSYDASSSSTINQLVCGLMENPHFLDVLERTSRRINSPQMTSQPAASCSTSSSRPFQTPVEEFRSLFRTGTASSTRRPVGMSLS